MSSSDPEGLVVLSTVTDSNLAQIMRIALENEGIPCEVDGSFQAGFTGVLAIRLLVSADDLNRARAILDAQANQAVISRSRPLRTNIQRICVPTDFSSHADCAVAYGLNLARQTHAELHLLHIIERGENLTEIQEHPDFTSDSLFVTEFLESLEQAGPDEAEKSVWADIPLKRAFRFGKPPQEICEYAAAERMDLVVLATHGRTGLKHLLMGSVAEEVVRSCPCPVLTVRPGQHDFLVEYQKNDN